MITYPPRETIKLKETKVSGTLDSGSEIETLEYIYVLLM